MGQINTTRIILLSIGLMVTSIFIYQKPVSKAAAKQEDLRQSLTVFGEWRSTGEVPLELNIVQALKLDDYINRNYTNGADTVSLYIGYYLTSKKVGAAHDPLVCFPGQGWQLFDKETGTLALDGDQNNVISYSMMTAERVQRKELVFYWFQSYDRTSPDTLSQKLTLLWKKIFSEKEDNAFVRITMNMDRRSEAECLEVISAFVRDFYPVFLNYVVEGR